MDRTASRNVTGLFKTATLLPCFLISWLLGSATLLIYKIMLACRMLGTIASVGRQGAVRLVQGSVCQVFPSPAASLRQSVIVRAMSATAQQVRTAVRALLRKGVDLNTTTERQIREELAQQLGSVEAHKRLIKVR
jgi:hypothetical protein